MRGWCGAAKTGDLNAETLSSLRRAEGRMRRRGILGFRTLPCCDGNAAECRGKWGKSAVLDAWKSGVKFFGDAMKRDRGASA